MRCNGNVTLQDKHVTCYLRITDAEWQQTKVCFIESGFIDSENNVLNWDKRQFISDSSAARVVLMVLRGARIAPESPVAHWIAPRTLQPGLMKGRHR